MTGAILRPPQLIERVIGGVRIDLPEASWDGAGRTRTAPAVAAADLRIPARPALYTLEAAARADGPPGPGRRRGGGGRADTPRAVYQAVGSSSDGPLPLDSAGGMAESYEILVVCAWYDRMDLAWAAICRAWRAGVDPALSPITVAEVAGGADSVIDDGPDRLYARPIQVTLLAPG